MYIDKLLLMSNAQALTATAASTDVIDLKNGENNLGIGTPMSVVITLDVAADDTTGDETYVAALETDSTSAFSSAATLGSVTITRGDVAGTKYVIALPADTNCEQYVRLNYTLGGTTPTVTVTAMMMPSCMIQNDVTYPGGFVVS